MGKYEEALERAKQGLPIDEVFPELKESEDERFARIVLDLPFKHEADYKFVRAYLEKQKEQKPNIELIQKSWYMEGYHDGKYNNEPKWLIQTGKEGPRYEENPKYGTQKPAEWSEEDEALMDELESYILFDKEFSEEQKKWRLDKLKSLRSQPHWKPSEEQMKHLERCFSHGHTSQLPNQHVLESLYEDLKKL